MAGPLTLSRRTFLAGLPLLIHSGAAGYAGPDIVTFSVLSLFQPRRLILHADTTSLDLQLDTQSLALDHGRPLPIDASGDRMVVAASNASRLSLAAPGNFAVEVPGKLRRIYRGSLAVTSHADRLTCVVGLDRELAVASIVAAESPPHAGPEALAAQAVASRSFVAAGPVHREASFCDTTHCQFLREAPPPGSPYTLAGEGTRGLVLQFRREGGGPETLAAMYSRSCGGRTRTLVELGLPSRGYPYYAVACAYCLAHPEVWQRDMAGAASTEQERMAYNRIHGWSALPGHADSAVGAKVTGRGVGHGLGMCQRGAAAMAARGAGFAEILAHYYPNTTVTRLG